MEGDDCRYRSGIRALYACEAEDSRQRDYFHISAYFRKLERISPSRVEAQSIFRMLGLRGVNSSACWLQ